MRQGPLFSGSVTYTEFFFSGVGGLKPFISKITRWALGLLTASDYLKLFLHLIKLNFMQCTIMEQKNEVMSFITDIIEFATLVQISDSVAHNHCSHLAIHTKMDQQLSFAYMGGCLV